MGNKQIMKKKILITGVAGFFGSNISRHLIPKGFEIVGIDNLSGGYIHNLIDEIKFYNYDITDAQNVDNIIKTEKPEYILHLAAYAAEGLIHYIRNYNYLNNLLGTTNIINSAVNNNVKKIIFTSSMAVYGDKNTPPFTEDMTPMPIDPYGIAKYACELDLKTAKEHFGLEYSIIRPHNIVGKYQNIWDKYRNVIGIWIRQALDNEKISVYGDGKQKRAFSDINYMFAPIEKLLNEHNGEIFNLGSDSPITIVDAAQIVQKCAKKFGFNPQITFLEERKEAKYAFCDHKKAKEMLDFSDNTDLEKVVYDMFSWAISSPKEDIKKMEYEINKNMYSFWGN